MEYQESSCTIAACVRTFRGHFEHACACARALGARKVRNLKSETAHLEIHRAKMDFSDRNCAFCVLIAFSQAAFQHKSEEVQEIEVSKAEKGLDSCLSRTGVRSKLGGFIIFQKRAHAFPRN